MVSLSCSWQTVGYCKIGSGHFQVLNAFIVMIAIKQIKHELFFLHMWDGPFQECIKNSGCPGRSILWFPLAVPGKLWDIVK